ncbi:hypothetical protein ACIBKX_20900 [Streptomyces sp. NPDC050658]|uniref:hypothetical protein n=1 Tax=unclassified Streptomyces TaxID=2593676 RepID=UPI00342A918F
MGHFERPRRVMRPGPQSAPQHSPGATPQHAATAGPRTRQGWAPRSSELREAVARLDAHLDAKATQELSDWIREQYTNAHGTVPLGFFARCFLGPPYVDHQLNLFAVIVEHFAPSDRVPAPFSGARSMVRPGGYAYVEVYSDGLLVPVLDDGTAVRGGDVLL